MPNDDTTPEDSANTGIPKSKHARPNRKRFSAEEVKKIETLAGYGLTTKDIARVMSLTPATLFRRLQSTPNARESVEKGRALQRSRVVETAARIAESGKHPIFTMFWLKCRARWTEKSIDERSLTKAQARALHSVNQVNVDQLWIEVQALMNEARTMPAPTPNTLPNTAFQVPSTLPDASAAKRA